MKKGTGNPIGTSKDFGFLKKEGGTLPERFINNFYSWKYETNNKYNTKAGI